MSTPRESVSLVHELFSSATAENIARRQRRAVIWRLVFFLSTLFGIVMLGVLLVSIFDGAFGLVAVEYEIPPEQLAIDGVPLEQLSAGQLDGILQERMPDYLYYALDDEKPMGERSHEDLLFWVYERVAALRVVENYNLLRSVLDRGSIVEETRRRFPNADLQVRAWLNGRFLVSQQDPDPEIAGIRPAIIGSMMIILITIAVAFPIGVGAAVYLEEYAARDRLINRIIQVNIYNLAGVPSIVYGLLGLAVFTRALASITSGLVFGIGDPSTANGRTILSAGLTMALLVLPIIIINAQEAIRAVPQSLRDSSYGIGATKWETTWHHVLPNSLDRILTGTILAISRAIGETAPVVVVGASTFVTLDPSGIFSKFTTLPMIIYNWSARPQSQYRAVAAAASIVLVALLLSLNAFAIVMRNRINAKRRMTS